MDYVFLVPAENKTIFTIIFLLEHVIYNYLVTSQFFDRFSCIIIVINETGITKLVMMNKSIVELFTTGSKKRF